MRFEEMNLAPEVVQASTQSGWDRPTPLQERAVPAILAGGDVAICQASGAGKTAAYLLPILHRLRTEERPGLRALLLLPEGDAAEKVHPLCQTLCGELGITYAAARTAGEELPAASLALATPRCFQPDPAALSSLEFLVVDGCEPWVEQGGGEEALRRAVASLSQGCQRILLSDAQGPAIARLHADLLRSPVILPALEGEQVAYPVPPPLKVALLLRLLADGQVPPSLLLARSRHRADRLFRALGRKGVRALRIQGRAGRGQRERWAAALESNQRTFLVAAELDTASYGALAVPSTVYFDTPGSVQGYSGRFQGAFFGPDGRTTIFVGPEEEPRLKEIESFFGAEIPRKTVEGFDYAVPEVPPEAEREEEGGEGAAEPEPRPDQGPRKGKGRKDRKREQGKKERQQGPQRKAQQVPEPRPEAGSEDEDEDGPQPDYNTDRPLFPGQRSFRWNSYRLSLERVEEGGRGRSGEAQEGAGGRGPKPQGKRRRKGRGGESDRPAGPQGKGQPPRDDDAQPDSNKGERRLSSSEFVARRFNRSARYSSLAGAPPPPQGNGGSREDEE